MNITTTSVRPTLPRHPRVAVLGASSAAGLGVHGNSYAVRVAQFLAAPQVLQLARSTQTITETLDTQLDELRGFTPDLVIASFGAAEALVHPGRRLQMLMDRFAPKSWQGVAGLEPRPYFSTSWRRRWRQKITSLIKILVKRVGIRLTGGYSRMTAVDFEEALRRLLRILDQMPCTVVIVGLWPVDPTLFPRSNDALAVNNHIIETAVADHPRVLHVQPIGLIRHWDDFLDDRAHLNVCGHEQLMNAILAALAASDLSTDSRTDTTTCFTAV